MFRGLSIVLEVLDHLEAMRGPLRKLEAVFASFFDFNG